jgi:hypothetical protein
MKWAGNVERVGEEKKLYNVLVGSPKERGHSEDRSVDGRRGLEWILEILAGGEGVWSGFTWLRLGAGGWLS